MTDDRMSDRPIEWGVTLHGTMGKQAGFGLSLRQCPTCCALVVEDFMPEHMAWHAVSASDEGQGPCG